MSVKPPSQKQLTSPPQRRLLPGPGASGRGRRVASSSRDIVPYNGVDAYLREIRKYPRLSREEEHDLAVQYKTQEDLEAAYTLISSNLWLVVKLARDYEKAARSLLDLIQEGNIGLMEAVKNFDPYRGVRFPSYASWWIKAYIIRYVIANWRMVKIGTTQAQRKLFFNLNKEKERLEREGFYPSPKLLANNLEVRESDVVEMQQRLSGADLSVDVPVGQDGDQTLLAVLPGDQTSAEDMLAKKQARTLFAESLGLFRETLNPKEKAILEERLLSDEKATLNDLAERFSISRERIRQIEQRIKEKFRDFLEERLGSDLPEVIEQS